MPFISRRHVPVLALCAALLSSACSGNEEPTTTPAPSSAAQAGTVVRQAVSSPDTAQPSDAATADPTPQVEASDNAPATTLAGESGYESPEAVRDAYIKAYEVKDFSPVLRFACSDYLTKYGTDTSKLEEQLSSYTVVGEAVGTATAITDARSELRMQLKLTSADGEKTASLKISVTKSDGVWRFCGEASAN